MKSTSKITLHTLACVTAALVLLSLPVRAEIFDLGGMYTCHYHDGRYADWGDYARHGARIAIDEVNSSWLSFEHCMRWT